MLTLRKCNSDVGQEERAGFWTLREGYYGENIEIEARVMMSASFEY